MFFTVCILLALSFWECRAQTGAMIYNLDQMAQSYCASQSKEYTFAIRRDCAGVGPTCNNICNAATEEILDNTRYRRNNVLCYDAVYIRVQNKLKQDQPDAGRVSMVTYGYGLGGCTWKANHCGPNYCCCKATM